MLPTKWLLRKPSVHQGHVSSLTSTARRMDWSLLQKLFPQLTHAVSIPSTQCIPFFRVAWALWLQLPGGRISDCRADTCPSTQMYSFYPTCLQTWRSWASQWEADRSETSALQTWRTLFIQCLGRFPHCCTWVDLIWKVRTDESVTEPIAEQKLVHRRRWPLPSQHGLRAQGA